MSKLVVDKDDHPEAARKHFEDAQVLQRASRHDGAAYHAGYVVECSLKSVLLHDRSYEPTTGAHDATKLAEWHKKLRSRQFGHDLEAILAATVGTEGARYLPPLHAGASVVSDWTETMRYWGPATSDSEASAYLAWAELAVHAVIQMTLDGVA